VQAKLRMWGLPSAWSEVLIVLGLMALAAALRLYRLNVLPPGFNVDEAYNMLDALDILKGKWPVFLPANAGREVLYSYLQAALVAWLGPRVFALRVTSALIGICTVGATYPLVRNLPLPRSRAVALFTALLLALSFYHLNFSRHGIRAITLPLIECLAFTAYWRGLSKESTHRMGWLALAGFWLGVGLYTHPAGRVMPLIPIAFTVYLIGRDREQAGRTLAGLAVLLAVAALVFAPLGIYFWTHPWTFTGHMAEVTVVDLGAPAQTLNVLARNAMRVLGMFNWHGEEAWGRNLSGRPIFDPLMGLFFVAGLFLLVTRELRGDRKHGQAGAFVLLWLAVMLLPTLLTGKAPDFSRAIGILPAVYIPPAVALVAGGEWVARRWGRALATGVVAIAVLFSGLWTMRDYFLVYARSPDMAYDHGQDKVDAATYINQAVAEGYRVYLSPFLASHPTVRFLTREARPPSFDPQRGLVLPPAEDRQDALYVTMSPWEPECTEALGRALGGLARTEVVRDSYGRPYVTAYMIPVANLTTIGDPLSVVERLGTPVQAVPGATFGGGIELLGFSLDRPLTSGQTSVLTLVWRARRPVEGDYTVFVHGVDATGHRWAQGDKRPLGGSYPTNVWAANEVILDHHPLAVDADAPDDLCLWVGLYLLDTGERLPVDGTDRTYVELGCDG
jgi:4-amino-4-deoxy-L-arabinose transferase-like glycosyltransferase